MRNFCNNLYQELTNGILPFWSGRMSDGHGGFHGKMDGKGTIIPDADRSAVLNARIIWTFAAAGRILKDSSPVAIAQDAADYFCRHFIDREYGGVFWSVTANGMPSDTKKQFYALAFAVYAFSELYRASDMPVYLNCAIDLFKTIEEHSFNPDYGGYIEARTRDWKDIGDMRLSEKDTNCVITMNTHLHILEAYTNLFRVWKDKRLELSLRTLTDIFLDRMVMPDGHLGLFFDKNWNLLSGNLSFGHEIEASWLLTEAAKILGWRIAEAEDASRTLAEASLDGYVPGAGMMYEYDSEAKRYDRDRHWWVQAESVAGFFHQHLLSSGKGNTVLAEEWLKRAEDIWTFIKKDIICPDGEWYWSAKESGRGFVPDTDGDRAGFWKCPYHNGRMCLEILEKTGYIK
ncbi:MAG: AGE family epimerase/isomerase [Candidatus Cryptobacteroides sp.]